MLRHLALATAIALGSVVIAAPAFAQDASSAQSSNASTPQQVVAGITHDLDTQIADHKAELQNNKPKLVALINQSKGRSCGLINPVLYANPKALSNIVHGNNDGFVAGPGWNACAGLGSPRGMALASVL